MISREYFHKYVIETFGYVLQVRNIVALICQYLMNDINEAVVYEKCL